MSFALNANAFAKCAPAISTNIKQCGSVTICSAKPMTEGDLTSAYMKTGEFRVMEALFHHDMEIKMCEAVQNGLYDFFMANKVAVHKTMQTRRLPGGLLEIAPFILARQYSPINNAYWLVTGGNDPALEGIDWQIIVASSTNIPADVRSFPVGLRIFIDGVSEGGSSTKTAWKVAAVTDNGDDTLTLNLTQENTGSFLDADKLGSPVTGLARRGTPNVNDFEKWCAEMPAYLNWKNVPFWVETVRNSMCKSDQYDKWRELVMADNALYKEFFDLDEIEKNKQIANDWQRRFVDQMFWGKALANQNATDYADLEDIPAFDIASTLLGVDGGTCVGKRANAIGIYELMAECGRVHDSQGTQLNLPALFQAFYNMMRVREGRNHPNPKVFDVFTDGVTAELINQAMIKYYNSKSDGMARLMVPVETFGKAKRANFGFSFRTYPLFWPQGVEFNVVTHYYFDDYLTAATAAGQADTARVLWILDFAGIYPGILASNRKVHRTGDLETLAKINADYACVMAVNTQQQTLTSVTWTMIVECPSANLIIENFSSEIPEHATLVGTYPGTLTTTTTTTAPQ